MAAFIVPSIAPSIVPFGATGRGLGEGAAAVASAGRDAGFRGEDSLGAVARTAAWAMPGLVTGAVIGAAIGEVASAFGLSTLAAGSGRSCVVETSFGIGSAGKIVVGGTGAEGVLAAFVSAETFKGCRELGAGFSVAGTVGDAIAPGVAETTGAEVATAAGTAPDAKVEVLGV
jgi:hypothetical protein